MTYIKKILHLIYIVFCEIQYKYLINASFVRMKKGSEMRVDKNVKIINSKIVVENGGTVVLKECVIVKRTKMHVLNEGYVIVEKNSILEAGYLKDRISVLVDGSLIIGQYNRLRCEFLIRFGGCVTIEDYNNINEETEIRADERVNIGSYNQISYKCIIWDTNTHNVYPHEIRRNLTQKWFPNFGYEYERPKTKKINIGNDCWIGQESALLKGVDVGNCCTVGFRTTLSNCYVPDGHTVIPKINNVNFNSYEK